MGVGGFGCGSGVFAAADAVAAATAAAFAAANDAANGDKGVVVDDAAAAKDSIVKGVGRNFDDCDGDDDVGDSAAFANDAAVIGCNFADFCEAEKVNDFDFSDADRDAVTAVVAGEITLDE
jgi:hypothetical protein